MSNFDAILDPSLYDPHRRKREAQMRGIGGTPFYAPCGVCGGMGVAYGGTCPTCAGSGTMPGGTTDGQASMSGTTAGAGGAVGGSGGGPGAG